MDLFSAEECLLNWVSSVKFTGTLCQQLFERNIGSIYTPFLTVNKREISCHKVLCDLDNSDLLASSLICHIGERFCLHM